MLNNKGQSLILFIIVLPILLFVLILVIDIGKVIVLNQELNNISEIVLDYGLDKLIDENNNLNNNIDNDFKNVMDNDSDIQLQDDNIKDDNKIDNNGMNSNSYSLLKEDIVKLIDLNKNDIDIVDVKIENNQINIYLEDNLEGVLSGLVNIDLFNIKSYYVGYIDSDNSKKIERISGD